MRRNWFYAMLEAEENADGGGLGKWFWLLAFLALEMFLIRWITQMQREAARRARVVDQARREAAKGQAEAPIQPAAKPLPEPEEAVDAPIQEAAIPLPEPEEDKIPSPAQESRPPERQDFRRLEGIGPKVDKLLHEAGIQTYADLAESKQERLRAILREANLYMMNSETWPQQAELAARGDWEALQRLKKRLKGGRKSEE